MKVKAWTDGACSGNPGPGGWGVVLMAYVDGKRHERELSGGKEATTNNEMELMAVEKAIAALKGGPHEVTIYTDSQLVHGYLMRGWKCKHQHLREILSQIRIHTADHEITIVKVLGHAGNRMNERADALAKGAIPR